MLDAAKLLEHRPILVSVHPGEWWPIWEFDVPNGAVTADIVGKPQLYQLSRILGFRDDSGFEWEAEFFEKDGS